MACSCPCSDTEGRSLAGARQTRAFQPRFFHPLLNDRCQILHTIGLKLDIHEEAALSHLERFASYRSNFQPIHLDWSFTQPVISIPYGYCSYPSSRLQNGIHLPSFRERTSLSLPYESTFCGLRFCERASILFPTALFQFYDWKAAKAGHPRRGCSKPFGALRSTFQPIYVGGSFTEAPCKWHNQSLRFPRSSVPTVLPAC
ncbi:hypothetical protein AVEN_275701-1, partial [Araneus ventricosus]